MNKNEAFKEINDIQDFYVDELIKKINDEDYAAMKYINFTSPTGTGKTKMMSKLINKKKDIFFIITTLSKGQLSLQIKTDLEKDCLYDNFIVYGLNEFRTNSKLQAEEIINKIPEGKECIWLRDEGHIKTNRYEEVLSDKCLKIINFSATNKYADIKCNFTQTMMLRTVKQQEGDYICALDKLVEVKKQHKKVPHYNPCAIMRCVSNDKNILNGIFKECEKRKLKYINITDENFNMADLCRDDNEYDVIINKFKLVEGIDIRRAHVIWMDNKPSNDSTTIQAIGRCRRNALLYRDDIDILDDKNSKLLKETRLCWVFYNVIKMNISVDENGELQNAFCDIISCEDIKSNTWIEVNDGYLNNGLLVYELQGCTGKFFVDKNLDLNMNYIKGVPFYNSKIVEVNNSKNVWMVYRDKDAFADRYVSVQKKRIPNLSFFLDNKKNKNFFYEKYKICEKQECVINDEIKKHFKEEILSFSEQISDFLKDKALDLIEIKTPNIKEVNKLLKTKEAKEMEKQIMNFKCWEHNFLWRTYGANEFLSSNEKKILIWYLIKNDLVSEFETYLRKIFKLKIKLFNSKYYTKKSKRSTYKNMFSVETFWYIVSNLNFTFLWMPPIHKVKIEKINIDIKEFTIEDCDNYINKIKTVVLNEGVKYIDFSTALSNSKIKINEIIDNFENYNIEVVIPCEKFCDKVDCKENKRVLNAYPIISETLFKEFHSYNIKINEWESAIIGFDTMKSIKSEETSQEFWIEDSSITSKIVFSSKLNKFLSRKYKKELERAQKNTFSGKNIFSLDKKCNSLLGVCVEYFAKYLLFGDSFLWKNRKLLEKYKNKKKKNAMVIRACLLEYRDEMSRVYGSGATKIIKTISAEKLIHEDYEEFVNIVVELGTKTAKYIKKTFYKGKPIRDNYDHNLSISHISGVADFISQDTILDVKVKNCITIENVKQVLAYHYLSTKRSDLNIKEVIIYDATSGKDLRIKIEPENLTTFFNPEDAPKI